MGVSRMSRRASLLAGIGLLGGCASEVAIGQPREMRASFVPAPDEMRGTLVGTLEFIFARGVLTFSHSVLLRTRGEAPLVRDQRDPPFEASLRGVDEMQAPTYTSSDSAGRGTAGNIFVRMAPPVPLEVHAIAINGHRARLRIEVPPLPITPVAARVTYVGSLQVFVAQWIDPETWMTVRPIVSWGVSDRGERDIPLLRERVPWLREREITTAIPSARGWPARPAGLA